MILASKSSEARASAERIRMDAARLCREANDKTTRTQSDVGRRLGDRIGDIEYWKTEVHNETDQMITEIDALNRAKAALEKIIADLETPLHIAQECLYNREKRQGIDLVHDDVERALLKVSPASQSVSQVFLVSNQDLGPIYDEVRFFVFGEVVI